MCKEENETMIAASVQVAATWPEDIVLPADVESSGATDTGLGESPGASPTPAEAMKTLFSLVAAYLLILLTIFSLGWSATLPKTTHRPSREVAASVLIRI